MTSPKAPGSRIVSLRSPQAGGSELDSQSGSPSGREYTSLASLMRAPHEPGSPTPSQTRGKRDRDRHVGWVIEAPEPSSDQKKDKSRLSLWQLIALTMSMGGSQVSSRSTSKLTTRLLGLCTRLDYD